MKKARWVLSGNAFLIFLGILVSCKREINSKADLIKYVNDPKNGLVKTLEINKIEAELRYKPWQLMEIDSKKWPKQTSTKTERAVKNKYFFVLSLSTNKKELLKQLPLAQYSEMVQVLSFRMTSYIDLTSDRNEPVTPDDCLFQQTYGMAKANQLLLVFDKTKLNKAQHLYIKIKEFGLGTGDLNFQMNTQDINDLPQIVMN